MVDHGTLYQHLTLLMRIKQKVIQNLCSSNHEQTCEEGTQGTSEPTPLCILATAEPVCDPSPPKSPDANCRPNASTSNRTLNEDKYGFFTTTYATIVRHYHSILISQSNHTKNVCYFGDVHRIDQTSSIYLSRDCDTISKRLTKITLFIDPSGRQPLVSG